MNKKEVLAVFKELILEVKSIPSTCIAILPDTFSSEYQIKMPIWGDDFDRAPIQKVASNHQRIWQEFDNEIIVK